MEIIVQKYGGTSTRSFESRQRMYENILTAIQANKKVLCVVSAMGRYGDPYATDSLLSNVNRNGLTKEELDRLSSIGETMSTLVIKSELTANGIKATSITNQELGITTDDCFLEANIEAINGDKIIALFNQYDVVVAPGFQGTTKHGKITTLGRGGSDLSAVALGIGVEAKEVEIYSDVDGIYTADPRLVSDAKKLDYISYEEMLELSCNGAKVLNHRCVQLAAKFGITIHSRSSFSKRKGTYVIGDDKMILNNLNKQTISGITGSLNEARITLVGVDSTKDGPNKLFKEIAEASVNVHVFNQALVGGGKADISFIINDEDLPLITNICNNLKKELDAKKIIVRGNIGKVSVIGIGIKNNHGIFNKVYETLSKNDINIEMTSCSEINISVFIDREDVNKAQALLHEVFID